MIDEFVAYLGSDPGQTFLMFATLEVILAVIIPPMARDVEKWWKS